MLRAIVLASVAAVVGYIIGVRTGFDAAVRDYTENDAELIEHVADEKDKFSGLPEELKDAMEEREEGDGEGEADGHGRTYQ